MELVDLKSNMFTLILVGTMSLKLLFHIFFMSNVFYEFFFFASAGPPADQFFFNFLVCIFGCHCPFIKYKIFFYYVNFKNFIFIKVKFLRHEASCWLPWQVGGVLDVLFTEEKHQVTCFMQQSHFSLPILQGPREISPVLKHQPVTNRTFCTLPHYLYFWHLENFLPFFIAPL